MIGAEVAALPLGPCSDNVRAAILAAAILTRDTGMTTAVLLSRQPEAVARARHLARRVGVLVSAQVDADSIDLRFHPCSGAGGPASNGEAREYRAPMPSAPMGVDPAPRPPREVGARCVATVLWLARCMAGR